MKQDDVNAQNVMQHSGRTIIAECILHSRKFILSTFSPKIVFFCPEERAYYFMFPVMLLLSLLLALGSFSCDNYCSCSICILFFFLNSFGVADVSAIHV